MLAPCALEQVITDARTPTSVKAPIICEGANGPVTPAADEILEDKGVLVLPDVLANAGGVVVSYFEWVQGLQEYFWKEDEVNAKLNDIVDAARSTRPGRPREQRRRADARGRLRPRRAARRRGDDHAWPLPVARRSSSTTREGCHLCERALEQVRGAAATSSASSSTRSTSPATPALEARYREWLPVVEIDGERRFTYYVDRPMRSAARSHKRRLRRPTSTERAGTIVRAVTKLDAKEDTVADRLTVGVAARLSRYLQVLTQAKKMGKDRISSQEIAEYTNINATQIRRDLSAFGKFGKRGVGYNIDSLLGEIRKILRTQGQHNIALVGAGRLGQAIASSPIFAEHGINIAAVFDNDPDEDRRAGRRRRRSASTAASPSAVREQEHHRRRPRRAGGRGAAGGRRSRRRRREDHLQLLRGAARDVPPT